MKHKTAICIASGPSLTQDDVDYCRGKATVYVVKECRHLAPWADVLYAADTDWWDKFNGCPDFAARKITVCADSAKKYGLECIKYRADLLWSNEQGRIATGGNSGFQVINIAALELIKNGITGDERIILLGYDMGFRPGTDKHWWEKDHPRTSRESNYARWLEHIAKAAPLVPLPVLNASRQSAIYSWPKVKLREVI